MPSHRYVGSDADSIAEFDFAELDEDVVRNKSMARALPGLDKASKPSLIQRLLSHLSIGAVGTETQKGRDEGMLEAGPVPVAIACRICEKHVSSKTFDEHTERCKATAQCADERSRTDGFLRRLLEYHKDTLYNGSEVIRRITDAALLEPARDSVKEAIVALAKLQYKLTKARVGHLANDPLFLHNHGRLEYLIEHKRALLERQQTLSAANSALNGTSFDEQGHGQEPIVAPRRGPLTHLVQSLLGSKRAARVGALSPSWPSNSPRSGQCLTPGCPRISDFDILKPISKGAYGSVFLVRSKRTGDLFALKAIQKSETHRKNSLAHALTERRALSLVKSQWVVSLYYAFQSDSYLFLVMEYMIGGDLGTLLRIHQRLSIDLVLFYAAELVAAVTLLHSTAGIIHHDLKPENVLIGADGHVKLIDLGLARLEALDAAAGSEGSRRPLYTKHYDSSPLGTPDYMAPEIVKGEEFGRPVDMWALGCLIYELFTGRPPFHDKEPEGIFKNIIEGTVDYSLFRSDAEQVLGGLLGRLLDPLAEKRPTADEVKDDLFFRNVSWASLREGLEPPFKPRPLSDDDTVYFELASGGKPSIIQDLQDARPLLVPDSTTTSPQHLLASERSPGRSFDSASGLSTSASSGSLSSSPFDSTFAFRNIDLLESMNKRLGQQMRQSGASSPLRRH